nr:hypothetical protein GCM10020093_113080 [Planobispora longispora]
MEAKAWGVEHLTPAERALKAIEAGADQFGGEACPELIVELVRAGLVSEERIDASVRRLLREKFRLGLFEHRFVDPDRAEEIVGSAESRALGESAQRRSLTVLTGDGVLPLRGRPRLYAEGVDPAVVAEYAEPAADPAGADVALLRLPTPTSRAPAASSRRSSAPDRSPSTTGGSRRSWPCWRRCPPWWRSGWSGPRSSRRSPRAPPRSSASTARTTAPCSTSSSAAPRRGTAPVRAAPVDGGGPQQPPRRAGRHRGPAVPARPRAGRPGLSTSRPALRGAAGTAVRRRPGGRAGRAVRDAQRRNGPVTS